MGLRDPVTEHWIVRFCFNQYFCNNLRLLVAVKSYWPTKLTYILTFCALAPHLAASGFFLQVHRWVNFSSMLKKCFVGKLVSGGMFDRAPQYGNLLAPPRGQSYPEITGGGNGNVTSTVIAVTVTVVYIHMDLFVCMYLCTVKNVIAP